MSVQTQIDRLASAKAAIKAAIEGKGVNVPDGTLLDGMASRIEAIEASGGGGGGSVPTTGGVTTLHINVTAVNPETMEVTFTADKTPAEMQQAWVNGPIWCVVTIAAGVMGAEAISLGVPPTLYNLKPAFGQVVWPLHKKDGNNDVSFVVSMRTSDTWNIDLIAFIG